MSKPRPFTPKAVELPRADGPKVCGGCWYWRPRGEGLGSCTVEPPDHVAKVTDYGPFCLYTVTADDTPACGRAEPK